MAALIRDGDTVLGTHRCLVPVRCWSFPGNTADTAIIRTIKDDLGG